MKTKTGIEIIADERLRQIESEGWTFKHDDKHTNGELARAAACYAIPSILRPFVKLGKLWAWSLSWWKPTPDDRIKELAKAGALIASEIDRINRL